MTEKGFGEMLRREGYIGGGHEQLTWSQVTAECALIASKRSELPAEARRIFLALESMKEKKIRLPPFVQAVKGNEPEPVPPELPFEKEPDVQE